MADRERTITDTEDDLMLTELRSSGVLGPFTVVDWAARTAIGRRERNEDRWRGDGSSFLVADGMGGRAGGEIAAQTAAESVFGELGRLSEYSARDIVTGANATVVRAGLSHDLEQIGSTLVALVDRNTHVLVLNCGDSRVYRRRDGEVELLTVDHTVRNELLGAGVSLEEAAAANVRLDALTAFLGQRNQLVPSFRVASFSVLHGDRFLLCSDGIHSPLTEIEIAGLLGAPTCDDAARDLVDEALHTGGDNATAVVVEFGTVEP